MLHAILLLQLTVTPQEAHHAEELVHASMRDYDLFEFDQALDEAVEGYRIDPLPAILFNIGQCHRALGHWEKAASFFQRYLQKLPDAPNRKLVEKLMAEVQASLAAGRAKPSPAGPEPQAAASPQPPPPAPRPAVASVPPAAVSTGGTVEASPSRGNGPLWLVGAGAVVAAVGGGLTVYEFASKQPLDQVTASQTQTANTVGYVGQSVLGVGAALLVSGVLWALLRPAAEPEASP